MISDWCVKFANEVYEAHAYNNDFYKTNKHRTEWIRNELHLNGLEYIHEARKLLAGLCADPEVSIAEKDKIHEALSLDATLRGTYDELPTPYVIH